MKKTIFTVTSIAVLCSAIILSCTKEDNSATKVTYTSQAANSTGNNPANHGGSTSATTGAVTAGTTSGSTSSTTSSTSGSTTSTNTATANFTVNGTAASGVTSSGAVNFAGYQVSVTDANGDIITILFNASAAPPSGNYSITNNTPSATQCNFSYQPNGSASASAASGIVKVTAGSSNTAVFSGIVCGASTISGTAKY